MNVATIVFLIVVFNISMFTITNQPVVGYLGLPPNLAITNYAGQNLFLTNAFGGFGSASTEAGQILHVAQCSTNATGGVNCSFIITGLQSVLATLLTFGYFMWGVLNLIPAMAQILFVPGQWMSIFLGGGTAASDVGLIYSVAFDVLFLDFLYVLVTGRYNLEVQ